VKLTVPNWMKLFEYYEEDTTPARMKESIVSLPC
jgi:hypothetical protein